MTSVPLSQVPRGCLRAEFDPTFPASLSPSISPSEFASSITRLNASLTPSPSTPYLLTLLLALFLASTITWVINSARFGALPLTFGAFGCSALALLGLGVGLLVSGAQAARRLLGAVEEEGRRYEGRVPAVSWRLVREEGGWQNGIGGAGQRRRSWMRVVVDVGREQGYAGGGYVQAVGGYAAPPYVAPPPQSFGYQPPVGYTQT